MKTFPTRLLMAFLVVLGLGVATQVQAQTVVKCDIPFAFSLGGVVHPSGPYSFTIGNGSGSKIVVVRRWDGSGVLLLPAGVEDRSQLADTSLKFNRYGDRYLLSSLSIAGDDISLQFAPTRAEREIMMARAQGEVVSILASR